MLSTPILFLVFNRPEATKEVFEAIRKNKPKKLYIAADGPRENKEGEIRLCNDTRAITEQIDWDCDIKTLFRDKNLGCKIAVSSAIDWFFDNEEEGIILEDDCLPHETFFPYCEELLATYRDDKRVMMISGLNVLGEFDHPYSYLFSKIGAIWGWATWKRAWDLYDVELKNFPKAKEEKLLHGILTETEQATARENICELVMNGKINTWDYQWTFSRLIHSGLSIVPSQNLIQNIGFDDNATHTSNPELEKLYPEFGQFNFPTVHPYYIAPVKEFDDKVYRFFNPIEANHLFARIVKKLKRVLYDQ